MTKSKTAELEIQPPELLFNFGPGSERKPIKMTYGLEMDIRRMLPDPQTAFELLLSDPVTQDYVLRRCLTDVNKMVTNFDELVDEEQFADLDYETRERLLMWAGDHAVYFFAKRTLGVANLGLRFEKLLPSLLPQSILDGLKASDLAEQSNGPSESSPKPE